MYQSDDTTTNTSLFISALENTVQVRSNVKCRQLALRMHFSIDHNVSEQDIRALHIVLQLATASTDQLHRSCSESPNSSTTKQEYVDSFWFACSYIAINCVTKSYKPWKNGCQPCRTLLHSLLGIHLLQLVQPCLTRLSGTGAPNTPVTLVHLTFPKPSRLDSISACKRSLAILQTRWCRQWCRVLSQRSPRMCPSWYKRWTITSNDCRWWDPSWCHYQMTLNVGRLRHQVSLLLSSHPQARYHTKQVTATRSNLLKRPPQYQARSLRLHWRLLHVLHK